MLPLKTEGLPFRWVERTIIMCSADGRTRNPKRNDLPQTLHTTNPQKEILMGKKTIAITLSVATLFVVTVVIKTTITT